MYVISGVYSCLFPGIAEWVLWALQDSTLGFKQVRVPGSYRDLEIRSRDVYLKPSVTPALVLSRHKAQPPMVYSGDRDGCFQEPLWV